MRQGLQIRRPCKVRIWNLPLSVKGCVLNATLSRQGLGYGGHGVDVNSRETDAKIKGIVYRLYKSLEKIRNGEKLSKKPSGKGNFNQKAEEDRLRGSAQRKIMQAINSLPIEQVAWLMLSYASSSLTYRRLYKKERGELRQLEDVCDKVLELEDRLSQLKAKNAAYAKHMNCPKQKAKEEIYELWLHWHYDAPEKYRSASAFARDMLDKFPELTSQQTVQRWVADWKREVEIDFLE